MPRKLTNQEVTQAKQQLMDDIESGELSLGQAVRRMRLITGKSQKDFAKNIIGISPRVLAEIERGVANPTVDTLNKIGRPFGYTVGFVRKNHSYVNRE
jgi:putative transcriptional regulator